MPSGILKGAAKAMPLTRDSYMDSDPDIRAILWGMDQRLKRDDYIYCLDASALSNTWIFYQPDVFPEVWECLAELAASEFAIAPAQTMEELRREADEGLLAWAEDNPALFHELDSEQEKLAAEITAKYDTLYRSDAERFDASPYVIALGVIRRERNPDKSLEYAVVADKMDNINRPDQLDVCEDPAYNIAYIGFIRMLRYLGLKVPSPKGSLIDLEGLWEGMEITEEDIEAVKYKTKWFPV
ncbi:MAG: DUF4411 family protein [Dehalococcoidia bacterium]|nr:DUF4411 family protein [Dehalococcoidia bacterium]